MLRKAPTILRQRAELLADLSPRSARARARDLALRAIDFEAIGDLGAQLERVTRGQFDRAMGSLLSTAKPRPTRGDKVRKPTTITIGGKAGTVEVRAPEAAGTVDRWTRRAASLIRDIADDVAEGIAADVAGAVAEGITSDELAARWRSQGLPLGDGGRLESRLALVADNQMARLNAELGRERAGAAGLESFAWITVGDSKVRELHRQLEAGGPYSYKSPPSEGLPGTPPNCRCRARTVVTDEDLARLLGV